MGTDIHGVWQKKVADKWEDISSNYEQERHYQLFAVLAGVRNGYGFAGVPTGETVSPISEPRGLPEDFLLVGVDTHPILSLDILDPRRRKWQALDKPLEIWMGDHSYSWLTGEEMLSWCPTAPTVTKCGVISREEYESWGKVSSPREYCGGISGRGIVVIEDNEVAKSTAPNWTHIRVYWKASLRDELTYFFEEVKKLTELHGEIRFVFGFDS